MSAREQTRAAIRARFILATAWPPYRVLRVFADELEFDPEILDLQRYLGIVKRIELLVSSPRASARRVVTVEGSAFSMRCIVRVFSPHDTARAFCERFCVSRRSRVHQARVSDLGVRGS